MWAPQATGYTVPLARSLPALSRHGNPTGGGPNLSQDGQVSAFGEKTQPSEERALVPVQPTAAARGRGVFNSPTPNTGAASLDRGHGPESQAYTYLVSYEL